MTITEAGFSSLKAFGYHDHRLSGEAELHYFTRGRGGFVANGKAFPIAPGKLFFSRSLDFHSADSTGNLPLCFFFVKLVGIEEDAEMDGLLTTLFGDSPCLDIGTVSQAAFDDIRLKAQSGDPLLMKSALHRLCGLLYDIAAGQEPLPPRGQAYVSEALALMQENLRGQLDLDSLSAKLGIDKSYFCRIFRQATGSSPIAFYTGLKVEAARYRLRDTNQPVAAIAAELGFRDEFHFSHCVKRATGMSPTAIRKRHRQTEISNGT